MLKFAKLEGLGNDFIIFDSIKQKLPDYGMLAKKVCDRNFGIGADGILIIEESDKADIKMLIYNSDGSQATMCGNGMRCFAKYVHDNRYVNRSEFLVETLAGILNIKVYVENGEVENVRVNMGKPIFSCESIPKSSKGNDFINREIEVEGIKYNVSTVIVGCVHTVLFTDNIDEVDVKGLGPLIEKHNIFPVNTNVDFCKIIDNNNIVVKTWEIGAGETLACGTGAASAAVISRLLSKVNDKVNVHLPGGIVEIQFIDNYVYMTGPAKLICFGEYNF